MKRVTKGAGAKAPVLSEDVDLDELFDGSTYQLTKGEDFTCAPSTAAQLVRAAFRARYGRVVITEDKDAGVIEVTTTRGSHWRK